MYDTVKEHNYFYQTVLSVVRIKKTNFLLTVLAIFFISLSQALLVALINIVMRIFELNKDIVQVSDLVSVKYFAYIPDFLQNHSFNMQNIVFSIIVTLFICGSTHALFVFLYQVQHQIFTLYIAKEYRDKVFASVLMLPYKESVVKSPATWMSNIMNDILLLQMRFAEVFTGLFKDTIMVFSFFIIIGLISWPSMVLLLIISPFIAFGMGRTGKKIAFYTNSVQQQLALISNHILDLRKRFDFIRSQNAEQLEIERFNTLNQNYFAMIKKSILVRSSFAPLMEFIGFAIFAFFLFLIHNKFIGDKLEVHTIVNFFVVLGMMLKPLRNIGEQLSRLHEIKGSIKVSQNIIEKSKLINNIENTRIVETSLFETLDSIKIKSLKSELIKRNNSNFQVVLKDITINKNSTLALVGESGSGKTTLIRILTGLIAAEKFTANIGLNVLTENISLVSQEPFLFSASILENLLYGSNIEPNNKLGSEKNLNEIWALLDQFELSKLVKELPDGLHTNFSAINTNLSGGQVQRFVIVRALLQNKKILLFDEATSALNTELEEKILDLVMKICRENKITFISITHRLQFLEKFQEVWYMKNGEIILQGHNSDLLRNKEYELFYKGQLLGEKK